MAIEQLGPYKLDKVLGRGGMGAVYVGHKPATGEEAAVKLLAPHLADDPNFRERFKIEVESLKKLLHPNIVQLFGHGEEAGHLFYAMELVRGHSLQDELSAGRRFNWREVTRIGIEVAKALKHAHDRGIIHRDLKPANLLIDARDHVKLTDFGIAKLYGGMQITADGGVLGTADYMSPEQADGKPATTRCDLYSLGSVLYALLAGRPPFAGASLAKVIHGLQFEQPIPIRRLAPDTPEAFEAIIMQLLEKEPLNRIPTALALANRLKAMEHALSVETRVGEPLDDELQDLPEELGGNSVVPGSPISSRQTVSLDTEDFAEDLAEDIAEENNLDHDSGEYRVSADDGSTAVPRAKRQLAKPPSGPAPHHRTLATHVSAGSAPREPPPTDPLPPTAKATHFTTISEAELRNATAGQAEATDSQQWLRIGLLLLATAAALGAIVWFATRPLSDAALFARIQAAAENDDPQSLAGVEGDMQQFVEHFPADPRTREVVALQEELELDRLERRFEVRARRPEAAESLLPIERAYLEAQQLAATDPAAAVVRFQAIVALYAGDDTTATAAQGKTAVALALEKRTAAQCLDLARRQIERLEKSVALMNAQERAFLERQLQRADELSETNRPAAENIWRSILELYGSKSGSADLVEQAQRKLGASAQAEHP
jgi:serine/threonine-protein kinase